LVSEFVDHRDIEARMFIVHRPIAAVLAALATSAVFAAIDLLFSHAAR